MIRASLYVLSCRAVSPRERTYRTTSTAPTSVAPAAAPAASVAASRSGASKTSSLIARTTAPRRRPTNSEPTTAPTIPTAASGGWRADMRSRCRFRGMNLVVGPAARRARRAILRGSSLTASFRGPSRGNSASWPTFAGRAPRHSTPRASEIEVGPAAEWGCKPSRARWIEAFLIPSAVR